MAVVDVASYLMHGDFTAHQRDRITALFTAVQGNINLSGLVSLPGVLSVSITLAQNNYNPTGLHLSSVLRVTTDFSPRNITGIVPARDGHLLIVCNVGSFTLALIDESASSTAANRFALNGNIILEPDDAAILWYDGTTDRWRCIGHTAVVDGSITTAKIADNAVTGAKLADALIFDAQARITAPANTTHDLFAAVLATSLHFNPGTIAVATAKQNDMIRGDITVDCDDAGTGRFDFLNVDIANNTSNAINSNCYGVVASITANGNSTSKALYGNAIGAIGSTGTLVGIVAGVRPVAGTTTAWALQISHGNTADAGIYVNGDVAGDTLVNGILFDNLTDYGTAVMQYNQRAGDGADFWRMLNSASTVISRIKSDGCLEVNAATSIDLIQAQAVQQFTNTTRTFQLQAVTATDLFRVIAGGVGDVFQAKASGYINSINGYEVGGTRVVNGRKTGWSTATGTATRTTFDTATVTLPQLAERVKAWIDDAHATAGHGLIGA